MDVAIRTRPLGKTFHGRPAVRVVTHEPDLEDVFLSYYEHEG